MKLYANKVLEKLTSALPKWQIKIFLAVVAFGIVLTVVLYTQSLVEELVKREQSIIHLYSGIYKHYSDPETNVEDMDFFLRGIIPTITFPIIITDENDKPLAPYQSYSINTDIDSTVSKEQQRLYLEKFLRKMIKTYPPIIIAQSDGKVLQKFYYTHSGLIDNLKFFPFISIAALFAFIFIGYVAFNNIRRSEESKVWVGMAKEAAHQLGTPISSLLAWLEIIRLNKENASYIEETIYEMQNDLNRLNTIATRFSKIGSMPEKKVESITNLLENTCLYFERRLPHLGKKVDIIRDLSDNVRAEVNNDLFQWVIENLLKNAAEAIENRRGTVFLRLRVQAGKKILITVQDTGKGMSPKMRRQIFYPGFTTKKRGWGLGLSLCKRIIEEYHHGKIYVRESIPGKGTTFSVEIPKTV